MLSDYTGMPSSGKMRRGRHAKQAKKAGQADHKSALDAAMSKGDHASASTAAFKLGNALKKMCGPKK